MSASLVIIPPSPGGFPEGSLSFPAEQCATNGYRLNHPMTTNRIYKISKSILCKIFTRLLRVGRNFAKRNHRNRAKFRGAVLFLFRFILSSRNECCETFT